MAMYLASLSGGFGKPSRRSAVLSAVMGLRIRRVSREAFTRWLPSLVPFVVIVGAHLIFRRLYYGDWLPHTYYAKLEFASQGERLARLFAGGAEELRAKLMALGEAIGGSAGPWLTLAGLAAVGTSGNSEDRSRPN